MNYPGNIYIDQLILQQLGLSRRAAVKVLDCHCNWLLKFDVRRIEGSNPHMKGKISDFQIFFFYDGPGIFNSCLSWTVIRRPLLRVN